MLEVIVFSCFCIRNPIYCFGEGLKETEENLHLHVPETKSAVTCCSQEERGTLGLYIGKTLV